MLLKAISTDNFKCNLKKMKRIKNKELKSWLRKRFVACVVCPTGSSNKVLYISSAHTIFTNQCHIYTTSPLFKVKVLKAKQSLLVTYCECLRHIYLTCHSHMCITDAYDAAHTGGEHAVWRRGPLSLAGGRALDLHQGPVCPPRLVHLLLLLRHPRL